MATKTPTIDIITIPTSRGTFPLDIAVKICPPKTQLIILKPSFEMKFKRQQNLEKYHPKNIAVPTICLKPDAGPNVEAKDEKTAPQSAPIIPAAIASLNESSYTIGPKKKPDAEVRDPHPEHHRKNMWTLENFGSLSEGNILSMPRDSAPKASILRERVASLDFSALEPTSAFSLTIIRSLSFIEMFKKSEMANLSRES